MRRVHVSHGRSRSRSRSPLLRGPKAVTSKAEPVNMLDQNALIALRSKRESRTTTTPKERITCPVDAPRRYGANPSRMSGGFNFLDRRRGESDRFYGGIQNRQSMRDRLSFGDRRGQERFESLRDTDRVSDNNRYNGKFRDEDGDHGKPVQRLIDPTAVPKGKGYFGHDDRGDEKQWRGRGSYDPRIDMGPRRDRYSFRGYGGRDRYDRKDRDGPPRSFSSRSAADGVWTHDKFIELEGEESDSEGVAVVVDQSSDEKTKRRVREEEQSPSEK